MTHMEKDFDRWNQNKKILQESPHKDYVHEREVWWCALGHNIGSEENGKNKKFERPVLVIRKFNKEMVLGVPFTSAIKTGPYYLNLVHDGVAFSVLLSQIRLISTKRLLRKMYRMDSSLCALVQHKLCAMIETNRPPLARGPREPHGHL